MSLLAAPFTAPLDLAAVPDHGTELAIRPTEAERAAIAEWLGIVGVDSLTATGLVSRKGQDQYLYEASFEAEIVQACVITLDPVRSHISGNFRRIFRLLPKSAARRRKAVVEPPGVFDLFGGDEDEPELLDSPIVDLAAALLEEVSLALDPYPKSPGASFEAPPAAAAPVESPFAVLEKLKAPGAGAPRPGESNASRKSRGKRGG
jgi:uncharacterized metal-binding protein YceD (DUF177 family)